MSATSVRYCHPEFGCDCAERIVALEADLRLERAKVAHLRACYEAQTSRRVDAELLLDGARSPIGRLALALGDKTCRDDLERLYTMGERFLR